MEKIQTFYKRLSDVGKDLHETQDQEFNSSQEIILSVPKATGNMLKYSEINQSGKTCTYAG